MTIVDSVQLRRKAIEDAFRMVRILPIYGSITGWLQADTVHRRRPVNFVKCSFSARLSDEPPAAIYLNIVRSAEDMITQRYWVEEPQDQEATIRLTADQAIALSQTLISHALAAKQADLKSKSI